MVWPTPMFLRPQPNLREWIDSKSVLKWTAFFKNSFRVLFSTFMLFFPTLTIFAQNVVILVWIIFCTYIELNGSYVSPWSNLNQFSWTDMSHKIIYSHSSTIKSDRFIKDLNVYNWKVRTVVVSDNLSHNTNSVAPNLWQLATSKENKIQLGDPFSIIK